MIADSLERHAQAIADKPRGDKATWRWSDSKGQHIPECSRFRVNGAGCVVRCGKELAVSELRDGTCSEGPHLPR
jgi:hypothetical protein